MNVWSDGIEWRTGADPYSEDELQSAERRWGFRFPPDLRELYLAGRPRSTDGTRIWDWARDEEASLEGILAWPLDGFIFDVESNKLWWPEWGARPADQAGRRAVLESVIRTAPKLIPIYSHRFIPAEPHEAGNPIFSVYQSDVVYYGALPRAYGTLPRAPIRSDPDAPWWPALRPISFWSTAVERSGLYGGL